MTVEAAPESGKLDALALKDTNKMELRVFGNDSLSPRGAGGAAGQPGQGRIGAAVQNLKLMLGTLTGHRAGLTWFKIDSWLRTRAYCPAA